MKTDKDGVPIIIFDRHSLNWEDTMDYNIMFLRVSERELNYKMLKSDTIIPFYELYSKIIGGAITIEDYRIMRNYYFDKTTPIKFEFEDQELGELCLSGSAWVKPDDCDLLNIILKTTPKDIRKAHQE